VAVHVLLDFIKVALTFPINKFHKQYLRQLANIHYDKCFY